MTAITQPYPIALVDQSGGTAGDVTWSPPAFTPGAGFIVIVAIESRGIGGDLLSYTPPAGAWLTASVSRAGGAPGGGDDLAQIWAILSDEITSPVTFTAGGGSAGASTEVHAKFATFATNDGPLVSLGLSSASDLDSPPSLTTPLWTTVDPEIPAHPVVYVGALIQWDAAPSAGISGPGLDDSEQWPSFGSDIAFHSGYMGLAGYDAATYGGELSTADDAGLLVGIEAGMFSVPPPATVPVPSPADAPDAYLCPKSVKACVLRLTLCNADGVALDPMTPESRIQTAGFAELGTSPDYESPSEVMAKSPSGQAIALVDRPASTLKGLNLDLKLCGFPSSVLTLLLDLVRLDHSGAAFALTDGYEPVCKPVLLLELWSKNAAPDCAAAGGRWIHWLCPLTVEWEISGTPTFNSGVAEISLKGYALANPVFVPSLPSAAFPSYVDGVPNGPLGPTLPPGVTADEWTVGQVEAIRTAGPLAWNVVDALPFPLADCAYLPPEAVCDPVPFADDFCGPAGEIGDPWGDLTFMGFPVDVLQLTGSCSVAYDPVVSPDGKPQGGVVEMVEGCCGYGQAQVDGTIEATTSVDGYDFFSPAALVGVRADGTTVVLTFMMRQYPDLVTEVGFQVAVFNATLGHIWIADAFALPIEVAPSLWDADGTYRSSMWWREDGVLVGELSVNGTVVLPFILSNVTAAMAGGTVAFDHAGVVLTTIGPDNPLPSSPATGFSLTCDATPPPEAVPVAATMLA